MPILPEPSMPLSISATGVGPTTKGPVREAVEAALDLLDRGEARVAERGANGAWRVNQWLKKARAALVPPQRFEVIPGGPGHAAWWDKVASKFDGWDAPRFRAAGFRAVPGCRGAALRLYRPRRGADALLRQCRRPCRQEAP